MSEHTLVVDGVDIGRAPDGSIAVRAGTDRGEPVGLSPVQAREVAILLLRLAAGDDA